MVTADNSQLPLLWTTAFWFLEYIWGVTPCPHAGQGLPAANFWLICVNKVLSTLPQNETPQSSHGIKLRIDFSWTHFFAKQHPCPVLLLFLWTSSESIPSIYQLYKHPFLVIWSWGSQANTFVRRIYPRKQIVRTESGVGSLACQMVMRTPSLVVGPFPGML